MTSRRDLALQFRRPLGRATLGDQLRRHAVNQPDKPAFVTYDAQGTAARSRYASSTAGPTAPPTRSRPSACSAATASR